MKFYRLVADEERMTIVMYFFYYIIKVNTWNRSKICCFLEYLFYEFMYNARDWYHGYKYDFKERRLKRERMNNMYGWYWKIKILWDVLDVRFKAYGVY